MPLNVQLVCLEKLSILYYILRDINSLVANINVAEVSSASEQRSITTFLDNEYVKASDVLRRLRAQFYSETQSRAKVFK